ncbi:aryl-alcohol dehydrogenase-like predicted oxidoreductase [Lipingzhangella halophila]|uniref:Aryl-alcohol dehydrogenase-like predicted oxidoreductase n=1 Tax=Lipingzhangella halophila TaxID=1783352 RepID=A0A7W7W4U7_9ACTN|nr:aldo/keto reductase [Lipingzhangella halophila]MBB4933973.1 aryl-alcohol dehydrogenase-like predicted oxidoreductase [Lipingzhangella halophila]
MRDVILGSTGLAVPAMGLGCMGLSSGYGPADHGESLAVLRRALDLGVRFWDTADAYGRGANETLLGEFLSGVRRDEVVLATKFGATFDPDTGAPTGARGDPDFIRQACDASLRRLGTEHIDLYYQHVPDPSVPIEESVGAMAELVAAGKVRYLGLSNLGSGQLRAAHGVHPIAAVQTEWSLFTRHIEESLVPACAELGVGLVPYSPLGRGFLTGQYTSTDALSADDLRHSYPRFSAENARHNRSLLEPLHEIAAAKGVTPAQVALAWVCQRSRTHGLSVVPIPGTKRTERLESNVAALDVDLTGDDLAALAPIADQVTGDRFPDLPPELRSLLPADA